MNIFEAITQRRSYRGEFQNRPIDEADLNQLIEAARWTPSPFNVQPWELVIIQESEGKEVLANITQQAIIEQFKDSKFLDDNSRWMCLNETEWQDRGDGVLLSDHVTLPKLLQNCPEKLTGSILKGLLKNAKSLTIMGHLGAGKMPAKEIATQVREAPLLILITMNTKRNPPGEGATRWMWLSMGMLIQNMLLAATSLDIGVQFVSAPLESETDRENICHLFNIPDYHEVMTLLRMGYIDSEDGSSVRLKPTEFVHYGKISN
ncbi:MAG: nitroreductase family protein [Candidatus Poribacteria bacterium]|nr:nitroreductase family protein [Candidatus Poribacteria bacterium]